MALPVTVPARVNAPAQGSPCERGTRPFSLRDATAADNAALLELAAVCPMAGELVLRIDRRPDFFALNRLEGERWKVVVAERDHGVIGCIAMSERLCLIDGRPATVGYVGDLKVHPEHRDRTVADALSRAAADHLRQTLAGAPVLVTVLAGNRSMESRLPGPRGLPRFTRVATVRTHSLSVLWQRRAALKSELKIGRAVDSDIDELADLWARVARERQMAPAMDAAALSEWMSRTPGPGVSSYLTARRRDGRIAGFMGVWDQHSFKQLAVERYSARLSLVRRAFNLLAPAVGAVPLPAVGAPLRLATAVSICVPASDPGILNALLVHACNDLRSSRHSFLNVGLDVRDPLTDALRGLLPQRTDVHAYLAGVPESRIREMTAFGPLHYEIALV